MIEAQRIKNLPPYLFAEIDRKIAEKKRQGVDVISLGIGDPDRPTPKNILDVMEKEIRNPANHKYPSYYGLPEFRRSVASWYKRKYNVELDPDSQVLPLIGSKEGIAHIYLALVDPGDTVLVPDPGYPVYSTGALLAGGIPHFMPLTEDNDYLPDFSKIPDDVARKAKLMMLNYPNNPTAATAKSDFYDEAIGFCKKNDIVLCHDFAYAEITFDGYKPPSLLERPGGMDVGVEFYSLSKTYNMTGWRIGALAGNTEVVEALGRVKTNIDSGIFNAIQKAGIEAIEGPQDSIDEMCALYKTRRDKVVARLEKFGWDVKKPKASIYIWVRVPEGYTSASFATKLLEESGVVVSPGSAYGDAGEGYFRISLTLDDARIDEALDRIEKAVSVSA